MKINRRSVPLARARSFVFLRLKSICGNKIISLCPDRHRAGGEALATTLIPIRRAIRRPRPHRTEQSRRVRVV